MNTRIEPCETNDSLQPSRQELDTALHEARSYWHSLAQQAITQYTRGLPPQSVSPRDMLQRVPSIPDSHANHCHAPLEITSSHAALQIRAKSTWSVLQGGDCGISGKEKTRPAFLPIGIRQATPLRFGNDAFTTWAGPKDEMPSGSNVIGILALGWAYIFSAELIERQGQDNASVVYTSVVAEMCSSTDDLQDVIDIGHVNDEVARWWIAILAPNQGWKAIVSQDDTGAQFISPWSVAVDAERRFKVTMRDRPSCTTPAASTPPSSQQALAFLVEFCRLHGTESQLSASLATAITLPTHNFYGTRAMLPFPSLLSQPRPPSTSANTSELYEHLPYYMALSCNPGVVVSSLCGVFWEPGVPCNLVSPWLHPVLNELRNFHFLGLSNYTELVTIMCAMRRPNLATLWLGATLSGLSGMILDFVGSGTPPLEPISSAWTGCPQSFMDVPGSGPYIQPDVAGMGMSRVDVWRLLYLPPAVDDDLLYNSPPFTPWEPVGITTSQHSAIRVRVHHGCPRHQLIYRHWSWLREDGSAIQDSGFKPNAIPDCLSMDAIMPTPKDFPTQALLDQEASMAASQEAFGWVTRNCEGYPPENIYSDEWLREESDEETFESLGDSNSSYKGGEDKPTDAHERVSSIQGWINSV